MKRFLSLLLTALMLLSLLACDAGKEPAEPSAPTAPLTEEPALPETDPVQEIAEKQAPDARPCLIETLYPREGPLVADIVATDKEYGADPTGKKDSTRAIQKALTECGERGGGTVYLPAGRYRLTTQLKFPVFVTLTGDRNVPENGGDYGTLIVADVKSNKTVTNALFRMNGGSGLCNLTVWYPNQSLEDVKPYPPTVYVPEVMLPTVSDVTFLNSYIGITSRREAPNEQLFIENVCGTVLNTGLDLSNSSDVGTVVNVDFSPSYWADAGEDYHAPTEEALRNYTKENAVGFRTADLDWTLFQNCTLSSFRTGVEIVHGLRSGFVGAFERLTVRDCGIGIDVTEASTVFGILIASSEIEGSEYSIRNTTSVGMKLTDVALKGAYVHDSASSMESSAKPPVPDVRIKRTQPAAKQLFVFKPQAKKTDCSEALQEYLYSAARQGGGIVYLPAGVYVLEKPIRVPSGVELRGSGDVANRDHTTSSGGTLIAAYYGQKVENKDYGVSLITLEARSILSNLRVYYPNIFNSTKEKDWECTYAVRGIGEAVSICNIAVVCGWNGIDLNGCSDFYVKKPEMYCIHNDLRIANCKGGFVDSVFHNGTLAARQKWASLGFKTEPNFGPNAVNGARTTFVQLYNAEDITFLNAFCYGAKTGFEAEGCKNVLLCNLGGDGIGREMLLVGSGGLDAVNMIRCSGASFAKGKDSGLHIYNRVTAGVQKEKNVE